MALPLIKGSDVFTGWTSVPAADFADSFESGDTSNWETYTSSGTIAASSVQKFEGSYSGKATVTSAGGYAFFKKGGILNAGDGGDVWITTRVYVDSSFDLTNNAIIFQAVEASSPYKVTSVQLTNSEQLAVWDPIDSSWHASTVTIPKGQWFSLRFHLKVGTSGRIQVWMNDTPAIDAAANTKAASNWSHIYVGIDAGAGDTPIINYDYVRISDSAPDPSVATGYYKTGITTQTNDAFANGTRLTVSPNSAYTSNYPMPYHLYEGAGRMGYDSYSDTVYIRSVGDADPSTQTIELSQRDSPIYINNKSSVTLKNISVKHANAGNNGGIKIDGPGGSNTITDVDASDNPGAGLQINAASSNNTISGGTFNDNIRWAIRIYQSDSNTVDGVTAEGTLEVLNGALVAQESDGVTMKNNTVKSATGYAINCYSSSSVIFKNNSLDGNQVGIFVEGDCPNYLIENNTITDTHEAAGISVSNTVEGSSPNGIIQYNNITDSFAGIELNYHIADSGTIRYNVIKNTKSSTLWGDIKVYQADNVHIYNNTLINGGGNGISIYGLVGNAPDNTLIKNNIVYGNTGYSLYLDVGGTGNEIDYNSYYKASGNLFYWLGTAYTSGQFSNYKNASSQDSNSIVSDPNLVNIAGEILNLSRTSPAINAGVDVGLTRDFENTSVPQGTKPDMGAYEYIPLTVTLNQVTGQADPTNSTVNFTVVFSESVADFTTSDVTLSGTAGATTGTVTGSGTTYNVAVTGMTSAGTVIASIAADKATGATGNTNAASTSTDNTVTYDIAVPTISNVSSTPSSSGSTITWTTSEDSSSKVDYGLTSSYGSSTSETDTGTRVQSHSVSLSGLSSCTIYHYRVRSIDAAGNETIDSDNSFTTSGTCPTPDSVAPLQGSTTLPQGCSDASPGSKAPWLYGAIAQDSNSILLYFTPADEPVNKHVLEYGTKSGVYPYGVLDMGVNSRGSMTYLVKSLSPNTTYYFRVRGGNGCATGTWSNEISSKTKSIFSINNLDITDSTLETVPNDEVKTPNTPNPPAGGPNSPNSPNVPDTNVEEQVGYSVKVKVVNKDKKPVSGATVTLHSNPQTTKTDKDGIALFYNVEQGEHKVLIAYSGYSGEQSINLTGDVKEFDLNITVQEKAIALSPLAYGIIGVMGLVIITMVVVITRLKKSRV